MMTFEKKALAKIENEDTTTYQELAETLHLMKADSAEAALLKDACDYLAFELDGVLDRTDIINDAYFADYLAENDYFLSGDEDEDERENLMDVDAQAFCAYRTVMIGSTPFLFLPVF